MVGEKAADVILSQLKEVKVNTSVPDRVSRWGHSRA
jgi:hypothetical protein